MNKKNVIVDVMSWARLIVTLPVLLAIGLWYLARCDRALAVLRRDKRAQRSAGVSTPARVDEAQSTSKIEARS